VIRRRIGPDTIALRLQREDWVRLTAPWHGRKDQRSSIDHHPAEHPDRALATGEI